MGCKVISNRHSILTFRIFWQGKRYWKSTGRKDTPENRAYVDALAAVITDAIEKGTFTLNWFEETNKPKASETQSAKTQTVGQYFRMWIERKKPPVIRKGLERDYREQFARYILPRFESLPLSDVSPVLLEAFRSYLLNERELSLKTVRNVMDATFRALWRDARKVDYLVDRDPFQALQWPRIPTARPDPFSEEERDAILAHFRAKVPFYSPFVHTLFWTGMRPSEALALRWGDTDLKAGYISISRSRYLDAEGSPKTAGSEREIRLLPAVVEFLKSAKPLHVTEKDLLFKNEKGEPLNFHTWRAKHWYRALRAKGMRERKPYATRHTFISVGLSNGVNIKWLAEYCGTSVAMIEKHYGRYLRSDSEGQLVRLLGDKPVTLAVTQGEGQPAKRAQVVENSARKGGGPTWIRTRDLPVMSRWL